MSVKFIQEYPDYKHADVESEIEDFMINNYQNNANYTIKDLKSFYRKSISHLNKIKPNEDKNYDKKIAIMLRQIYK